MESKENTHMLNDDAFIKNEALVSKDDKKFVSKAVAFVIGHCRNGFVPLCASVATLLQEQERLKQEVALLKQEIKQLNHPGVRNCSSVESDFVGITCDKLKHNNAICRVHPLQSKNKDLLVSAEYQESTNDEKTYTPTIKFLADCLCDKCCNSTENCLFLTPPISKGNIVIISGEIIGTVCYVGHLDSDQQSSDIYVGLHLDEPVGNSNGCINGKVYFSTRNNHGIFVPLSFIRCIVN